jgi:hypothetical protein
MKETGDIMVTANDHFKSYMTRSEQIKNERIQEEKREQATKRKLNTRRQFDNARLVDKYFPNIESVELESLLCVLADNPELYKKVEEAAECSLPS